MAAMPCTLHTSQTLAKVQPCVPSQPGCTPSRRRMQFRTPGKQQQPTGSPPPCRQRLRAAAARAATDSQPEPARLQDAQQQQQLEPPAELPLLLDRVRIVLVAPKTPANIGSSLRLAENFEVGGSCWAGVAGWRYEEGGWDC